MAVVTYLVAELMKRLEDEERLEVLSYLNWEEVESWRRTFDKVNDLRLMDQATVLGRQKFNLNIAPSEPTIAQPISPKPTVISPSPSSAPSSRRVRYEPIDESNDWEKELEELRRALRGHGGNQ